MKEIYTALQLAQSQFKPVHKTKQGYGYKYAPLDAVVDAVKDALKANGLFFTQSVGFVKDANDKLSTTCMITTLGHTSGQKLESSCPLIIDHLAKTSPMQGLGSAITYARRYGLSAILGIVTEEDTDAAATQDNVPKGSQTQNSGIPKQGSVKVTWADQVPHSSDLHGDAQEMDSEPPFAAEPPSCQRHQRPMAKSSFNSGSYYCTIKVDGKLCPEKWPKK